MDVAGSDTTLTPEKPGVFKVASSLRDDDSASDSDELWLVVTDDRECRNKENFWRAQYGNGDIDTALLDIDSPGPLLQVLNFSPSDSSYRSQPSLSGETLDRYLHVLEFASPTLSELFCTSRHDVSCLRETVAGLLTGNSLDMRDGDPSHMRGKALAQIVCAWLNFAAGTVDWDEELEPGGESFHEALERLEGVVLDPQSTHVDFVAAKDEATAINHEPDQHCND